MPLYDIRAKRNLSPKDVLTSERYTGGDIMKKYICTACSWVYDPEVGDPDSGIKPGTAFEDIPDDWECPICGVTKDMFEEYEE